VNKAVDKIMGAIFGAPAVHNPGNIMGPMNRHAKRASMSQRMKISAEPNRRKFEKRGAVGRASKGRKPHARS